MFRTARRAAPAVLVALLACGSAGDAEVAGESWSYVNLLPDFVAYRDACRDADAPTRAARWREMLEARHPAFFRDVIYRKLEGVPRDDYERDCVRRFWSEMAPRLDALAERARALEARVREVVARFRETFRGADLGTDVVATISFSFRGKVVDVDGRNVLALGLETFEDDGAQVPITIAHELFHLHHFRTFSPSGALYRTLWAEGLATHASAVVVPGQRSSAYLGFSAEKMNLCERLLPELAADLRAHRGEDDARRKRLYFGAEENDTKVPPESGYYVGLLLVQALAKETAVGELAKLTPEQVFPLVDRELGRLVGR